MHSSETCPDGPTGHTAWDVVTLTALATLVGALPHIAVGRAPRLDELARRLLTVAFAAAVFRPVWNRGEFRRFSPMTT